jgi:glycosyltransferase involved in cell wall biosynthesis
MFAKLLGGVSYSISHHEYLTEFGPNQKQKWMHARFGHTISRVHLDELRAKLGSAVPDDMEIAPMGIEPENFARRRPYEPWNHEGEFRVFSCGRLSRGKNQLLLIQAVAKLRNDGIPATLTLAGGDESPGKVYLAELQKLVSELKLEPYVRFLGQTAENDVIANLEIAHVAALASLHEGVPVVIMEAMAMDLPVVATDVGGMRDLVLHAEEGLLVPPGDTDAMADALSLVAHSPVLARGMGAAARLKVIKGFHSGVSASALAAQMARHLEAPSARPDHARLASAHMPNANKARSIVGGVEAPATSVPPAR